MWWLRHGRAVSCSRGGVTWQLWQSQPSLSLPSSLSPRLSPTLSATLPLSLPLPAPHQCRLDAEGGVVEPEIEIGRRVAVELGVGDGEGAQGAVEVEGEH